MITFFSFQFPVPCFMDSHVDRLSSFIGFPLKNLLGERRIVLGKRRREVSIYRKELLILSQLDKSNTNTDKMAWD